MRHLRFLLPLLLVLSLTSVFAVTAEINGDPPILLIENRETSSSVSVPADSYLTVKNTTAGALTLSWNETVSYYYAKLSGEGTVEAFDQATGENCSIPAGSTLVLEFAEEVVCSWDSAAQPETVVTQGAYMQRHTIPYGHMLEMTVDENSAAMNPQVSWVDGDTPDFQSLSFLTTSATNISFSSSTSAHKLSVVPGYTCQISPVSGSMEIYYPACLLDMGLSCELVSGQPLTHLTVEKGTTFRAKLPVDAPSRVTLQTSGTAVSSLSYCTADYSSVAYSMRNTYYSNDIPQGYTLELCPLEEDLDLYYPSFYGTFYLFTCETVPGSHSASFEVPLGKTLRASSSATAPGGFNLTFQSTGTSTYSYVSHNTENFGGLQFSANHSRDFFSMQRGTTLLLRPLEAGVTVHYPVLLTQQYGLTLTLEDADPIASYQVPLGKTLKANLSETAPDSFSPHLVGSTSEVAFDYVTYAANDAGLAYQISYEKDYVRGYFTFKRHITSLLRPVDEAMTLYYPALVTREYGMTLELTDEELIATCIVPKDKTVNAYVSADAPDSVSITLRGAETGNGSPFFQYVQYTADSYTDLAYEMDYSRGWLVFPKGKITALRPRDESMILIYPQIIASDYGFSYTMTDEVPIQTFCVAPEEKLISSISADAPGNLKVNVRNKETHALYDSFDIVSYDTDTYRNISFDTHNSPTVEYRKGQINEFSPVSKTMEFYYPSILADLYGFTYTIVPGEPLVFDTVQPGSTLRITPAGTSISTANIAVRAGGNIYPNYQHLRYVTADCSGVTYSASQNSHTVSLNDGFTTEIAPLSREITVYYPAFYQTLFPFETESYQGQPITNETLAPGTILTARADSNPLGTPVISFSNASSGYPTLSFVKYDTGTYANVDYASERWMDSYTLEIGRTNLIVAETEGITFSFPTFYLDRYAMTFDMESTGHPLKYGQVPQGYTLRANLSDKAPVGISMKLSGGSSDPIHNLVHYETADCGSLSFDTKVNRDTLKVLPKCTVEMAPCETAISYYYPVLFEEQYGLTVEEPYPGDPISVGTVSLGYTLVTTLHEDSPMENMQLSLSGSQLDHEYLIYTTADHSNVIYTSCQSVDTIKLTPGQTCELAPTQATIQFSYPTVYRTRFGLSFDLYKGSPMTTYTAAAGESLKLSLDSQTTEKLSLLLSSPGQLSYDQLGYCTEDMTNVEFYLSRTYGSVEVRNGSTWELSPVQDALELTFPTFYGEVYGFSCSLEERACVEKSVLPAGEIFTLNMSTQSPSSTPLKVTGNQSITYDLLRYDGENPGEHEYLYHNSQRNLTLDPGDVLRLCPVWSEMVLYYPYFLEETLLTLLDSEVGELTRSAYFDSTTYLEMSLPADAPAELNLKLVNSGKEAPSFTMAYKPLDGSADAVSTTVTSTSMTVSPGFSYTLSEPAMGVTVYYPVFFEDQFGFRCSAGTGEPKEEVVIPEGGGLLVQVPDGVPKNLGLRMSARADQTERYYLISYDNGTGEALTFSRPLNYSRVLLEGGKTYLISPVSGSLSAEYPSRYELEYGLSVEMMEYLPTMQAVPLAVGETMTVSLGENAKGPLSLPVESRGAPIAYLSRIHYRTDTYGGLQQNESAVQEVTLFPGQTCQITPLVRDAVIYLPDDNFTHGPGFQFQYQQSEDSMFATEEVISGSTLTFKLAADSPNKSVNIYASAETESILFDYVTYKTSDGSDCSYGTSLDKVSLKAGYTLEVSPQNRAITFCYPAVLAGESLTVPEEGRLSVPVLYQHPLKKGDTIHLIRPKGVAAARMTIENLRDMPFSFALYEEDGLTCTAMNRSTTDRITLQPQQSVVITSQEDNSLLFLPRYWMEEGRLAIHTMSAPALYKETVTYNEYAIYDRYQLAENAPSFVSAMHKNTMSMDSSLIQTDLSNSKASSTAIGQEGNLILNQGFSYQVYPTLGSTDIYFPGRLVSEELILRNGKPFGKKCTEVEVVNAAKFLQLSEDTRSVMVYAYTLEGSLAPLAGASVTVDGLTVVTGDTTSGSWGRAHFTGLSGSEEIVVTHPDYRTFEGAREFSESNTTTLIVLGSGNPNSPAPYLKSVTAQYGTGRYDLLHNSLMVYLQQAKINGTLEVLPAELDFLDVRVSWGNYEPGEVRLYRKSPVGFVGSEMTLIGKASQGNFARLNLSKEACTSLDYYIVTVDANGNEVGKFNINLDTTLVELSEDESVSGEINLVELISFITGDITMFQNLNMKLEQSKLDALSVEYDPDMIKMAVGFEFGGGGDDEEEYNFSKMVTDIESMAKNLSSGKKEEYQKEFKEMDDKVEGKPVSFVTGGVDEREKAPEGDTGSSGGSDSGGSDTSDGEKKPKETKSGDPEFTFNVGGYVLIDRNENRLQESKITLGADGNFFTYETIRPLPPLFYIPTFYSLLTEAKGDASLVLGYDAPSFRGEGKIGLEGVLTADVGVGLPKALSSTIKGGGTLAGNLAFLPGNSVPCSDPSVFNPIFHPEVTLDLTAELAVVMTLLGQDVCNFNLWKDTFPLYPAPAAYAMMRRDMERLNPDLIDLSAPLPVQNLAYQQYDSSWLGSTPTVATFARGPQREESLLMSNISPGAQPILARMNADKLLLWVEDNADRAVRDRTMLVWSLWDEDAGTWSEPQPLWDNGFADIYPVVQGDWVTWVKLNRTMGEGEVSINDMAVACEVAAAHWNGEGFDTPVLLTDDDLLDAQPVVASDGTRTAMIWTRNTENDILGVTGTSSVVVRQLNEDGDWSAPEVLAQDCSAITNLCAAYDESGLRVAFTEDSDRSFLTTSDRPLTLLTVNGPDVIRQQMAECGMEPQFASFGGELALFYQEGAQLKCIEDLSEPETVSAPLGETALSSGCSVVTNSDGQAALLWSGASDGKLEIFGSLYNGAEWTPGICFSRGEASVHHISGLYSDEGVLELSFIRSNQVYDVQQDGSETSVYLNDLCMLEITPSYDLVVGAPYYSAQDVKSNAVLDLSVPVENLGELTAQAVQVHVYTEDGQIDVTVVPENSRLGVGREKTLVVPIVLPEKMPLQSLFVQVLPVENGQTCADLHEEDNLTSTQFGGHDLVVVDGQLLQTASSAATEESYLFLATVSNAGMSDAPAATAMLRRGSNTGEVLAVQTLDVMPKGSSAIVQFGVQLDRGWDIREEERFYITVESENDICPGNDSTAFYINRPDTEPYSSVDAVTADPTDPCLVTVTGTLANRTVDIRSGMVCCAVYDGDGRQIGVTTLPELTVESFMELPVTCQVALKTPWSAECSAKLFYLDEQTFNPITIAS